MINLNFETLQYNIYGSKSSVDTDIFVKLDIPSENLQKTKEMQDLRFELKKYFSKFYNEPNINIGVVENGVITHCFIGLPDELNNSIYYTYDLHEQKYDKVVNQVVPRDKYSKIHKTLISVLSYFSRTTYRKVVKSALKSNDDKAMANTIISLLTDNDFINELKQIDIIKKMDKKEVYKKIYFKLLVTSLLLDDIEVYTKEEAIKYVDDIGRKILYREFPIDNLDLHMSNFIVKHTNKILEEIKTHLTK